MKKLFFTIIGLALALTGWAQEKTAADYRDEGLAHMQNHKSQQALESFKMAIAMWPDTISEADTYLNAAKCAKAIKDYALAEQYYGECIGMRYMVAECEYEICKIHKAQGLMDKYESELKNGFEKHKVGKYGAFFRREYAGLIRDRAFQEVKDASEMKKKLAKAKEDEVEKMKSEISAKLEKSQEILKEALTINPKDQLSRKLQNRIERELSSL